MEPAEHLHRLVQPRSHREGPHRSARRSAHAAHARPHLRRGLQQSAKRAQRTLDIILSELGQSNIPTHFDEALNERHYGDLCGLNKDEARERWGEDQVQIWRRSYDVPPPGGESLKDTAERVLPYYKNKIWPDLLAGNTVLVVAHGNSLRALIMELENLTSKEILDRELATGARSSTASTPRACRSSATTSCRRAASTPRKRIASERSEQWRSKKFSRRSMTMIASNATG
jgi:2,3-bisphosphoglycerate-dependent phosphoglycerate mutase